MRTLIRKLHTPLRLRVLLKSHSLLELQISHIRMGSTYQCENQFFRHCDKQTHEPVKGKVTGDIPNWLEGTLIRNGSGIFQIGEEKYKHLFDGLSLLHRFEIKNGEATYQSRALESDVHKANMANQRIMVSEFGTKVFKDPCNTLFSRIKSTFVSTLSAKREEFENDNCSVNVAYYGDQLYAMTETNFIRRIDSENLKSIGPKTRIRDYVVMNSATAHPHVLEDGTVLNMGNNYRHKKGGPHYCIVQIPPSFDNGDESSYKNAKIVAEIPARWKWHPSYYHSFGMTTDKIIFIESPFVLNIPTILVSDITKKSYQESMSWYAGEKARFYVVSLKDGTVSPIVYESEGFFAFHHINAYEENGHIVVDVAAYNSGDIIHELTVAMMNTPGKWMKGATARRFVLPLNISEGEKPGANLVELPNTTATATLRSNTKAGVIVDCTPHHLSEKWLELPRINYKYNGKHYQYTYGVTSDHPGRQGIDEPHVICKIDVTTGEEKQWSIKNIMVSEPIFVPNPTVENPAEDDGVVLTAVLHKEAPEDVTLEILDAKNLEELASVRFKAHGVVTGTFHGMWANKKDKIHTY